MVRYWILDDFLQGKMLDTSGRRADNLLSGKDVGY